MDETNPYLNTVLADGADTLRQSLQTAVDKQPDREAELQGLARQYRLPVEAVRLDSETVQRRAKLDALDYGSLVKNLPVTAGLLADPQKAAIAHDDIDNLGALEQALKFGKNTGKALLSGLYGFSEGVAGQAEAGADLLSKYLTGPLADSRLLPVNIAAPVADAFREIRRSQTAWRNYLTPVGEGNIESGYYSGLQSLTQNLLTLPLAVASDNPGLALNTMALNTGGQSYGRARDQGLQAPKAFLYGTADAAVEYATEKLPLGLLFKDLKAGTPFFKMLTQQLASEIPGEQAATVLQDLNEWSVLNPEKTLTEFLAERPDAAMQTLVATAVGSGGQTGILQGVNAIARRNAGQSEAATVQAENLRQINALAAASKVLPRDTGILKSFVDAAVANGPAQHVYIDAQTFAQQDIPEQQASALPEVLKQLPDALAAGGEISIPLRDYVAHIAPHDFAQGLVEHIRLEGEEFSRAEAVRYLDSHPKNLQTEVESALKSSRDERVYLRSLQSVSWAIRRQLHDVSPFSAKVNDNYAMLVSHYYAVQAKKFGLSPGELYKQYPLNVAVKNGKAGQWLQQLLPQAITQGEADKSAVSAVQPVENDAGEIAPAEWQSATQPDNRFQQGESPGRGSYNPLTLTITLNKSADLSTFLHESAHFFLEVQFDLTRRIVYPASGAIPDSGQAGEGFRQRGRPKGSRGEAEGAAPAETKADAASEKAALDNNFPEHPVFSNDYLDKHLLRDDLPPGDYAGKTRIVVEGTRLLGTHKVRTPEEAAQAMAYLHHYAVERFDALVTDKAGKPLAIVGAFKGNRSETVAYKDTLAAEAFRIKGAAFIWFAHNHPGGPDYLSRADRLVNRTLNEVFRGSEITPQGFLAIGSKIKNGRSWTFEPSRPYTNEPSQKPNYQPGDIRGVTKKPKKTLLVPVLERVFADDSSLSFRTMQQPITNEFIASFSKGLSGVLLMNGSWWPKAFVPIKSQEIEELRADGRIDALHRVLSVSNAERAIIINHGDMSETAIGNLAEFFQIMEVYLLDVLEVQEQAANFRSKSNASLAFRDQLGFRQSDVPNREEEPAPGREHSEGGNESASAFAETGKQQLIDDSRTLLDWFGLDELEDWYHLNFEQQRRFHEKFAEGFEAYLFEGKSPSLALQGVFERFRAWLMKIYRSIRDLHADLNAEVRGVFDRMLASEDEIRLAEQSRAMQPMFKTAHDAGMDDRAFAEYQALADAASASAEGVLQQKSIADMQWLQDAQNKLLQRLQQRRKSLRQIVRKRVSEEVWDQMLYAAWELLTMPHYNEWLDEETLFEMDLPKGMVSRLRSLGMVKANADYPIDAIADWYFFSSGDELVRALATAEEPNHLIRRVTDQRMLENYGDLSSKQALKRIVLQAIHNRLRGEFLAVEADTLAAKAGESRFLADTLADYAESLVRDLRLTKIRAEQYHRAETRNAGLAENALKAGDIKQAAIAKRQQLINFYAAKSVLHIEEELAEGLVYFQRFYSPGVQLSDESHMLIRDLLFKFGLGMKTEAEEDKISLLDKQDKISLLDWMQALKNQGLEPYLPLKIINSPKVSFLDLSIVELKALQDLIKQIERLDKWEKQMLTGPRKHRFTILEAGMMSSMLVNAHLNNLYDKLMMTKVEGFDATANRAARWALMMDGGIPGGRVWHYLIRPAIQSNELESSLRGQAVQRFAEILQPIFKQGKLFGKGRYFPSIKRSLNREMCLAIGLNTGNEGNLQALLEGEGWQLKQLTPILASLTAEDWQAVQQIWDYFETLRPAITEKQRHIYGITPPGLQLRPRRQAAKTASGDLVQLALRGGYYPVVLDPLSTDISQAEAISATTRRTFFKPYQALPEKRPLLYSLSGLYSGCNDIIYDLAWHDNLVDIKRFANSENLKQSIQQYYGPKAFADILAWVDEIAGGRQAEVQHNDLIFAKLRQSSIPAGLGFKALSAAFKPLDFQQAAAKLRLDDLLSGISRLLADMPGAVELILSKSAYMWQYSLTFSRQLNEIRKRRRDGEQPVVHSLADLMVLHAQQLTVTPIWLAVYQRSIISGQGEAASVEQADSAVAALDLAQHKDLARNPALLEKITEFYSYVSVANTYGAVPEDGELARIKLMAAYLFEYPIPLVLGDVLKQALTAGDSEYSWQALTRRAVENQLDAQMPLLLALKEFEESQSMLGGNLPKSLTGQRPKRRRNGGKSADNAVVNSSVNSDFDQAFWRAAAKLVEGLSDRTVGVDEANGGSWRGFSAY